MAVNFEITKRETGLFRACLIQSEEPIKEESRRTWLGSFQTAVLLTACGVWLAEEQPQAIHKLLADRRLPRKWRILVLYYKIGESQVASSP